MRALARWGVTPLLASPLAASALGLGDIELKSALNQPLQAEITLVSATPEELEGLRIALAARETFARYGLDRPEYLSALQFSLDRDAAGRTIIRVTSRESIAEPFVTMLIEATWPRGRLLREYTVLLDPPVLLPQPAVAAAVNTPSTRPADGAAGGSIARPAAPAPAAQPPTAAPVAAPAPRASVAPGGTYGPVQRAETLWNIADNLRPAGVSVNQMMVALYEANGEAFGGNMNRLLQGAVLRVPDAAALRGVTASVANAEVRRQTEEWQGGAVATETARLRLRPADEVGAGASAAPAAGAGATPAPAANAAELTSLQGEVTALRSELEESRRLLELRNEELRQLQERLAAADNLPVPAAAVDQPLPAEPVTAPGVDLEEQLFADDEPGVAEPQPEAEVAEAPAPVAAPPPAATRVVSTQPEPSLLSRVLGWVSNPMVLIGVGIAALLLAVVGFMRRRREEEPEDVTGRWDALEEEIERDEHENTARMRRQVPDDGFVVEEQTVRRPRSDTGRIEPDVGAAAAFGVAAGAAALENDETLSAQTVIDLDQADPVAEADFHMAYGLYDQAAELITKALEHNPGRRDLQLKLLDVFFVWGNKEGFLSAAEELREQIGDRPDGDWGKVVIMGKQICPDASLFAEATTGAPEIDLEFDAGSTSPALDLAFEDDSAGGQSLDFNPAADETAEDLAFSPTTRRSQQLQSVDLDDSLDIGERTAAGLEAALFEGDGDDTSTRPVPEIDPDSLAVTQESPTVERPSSGLDWDALSIDSPTGQVAAADAPTVETPTVESLAADAPTMETPTVESLAADAPTMETPTIETPAADAPTMETPTVETAFWQDEPATVESPEYVADDGTAEIDLDDLGLDVADLEALPADLGELAAAPDRETDTREQPQIGGDSDLLSATGVTQVLSADFEDLEQRETAVLADDDATMLASLDEDTLAGTEVLDSRYKVEATGETSLVQSLQDDGGLDLNLDDLSAALQSGGDTVEQPRMLGSDVFGGNGSTPLDLDVGLDVIGADDPTGTEEASPLDPQTMTEVGTKLDLARAYIDMGDPEGARSILEEVLDEGDAGQRREAQNLIEGLAV